MPAIDVRSGVLIGLLMTAGWSGLDRWTHRPRHPPDGEIASAEPIQSEELPSGPAVMHGRWTLQPRARYEITARILGTERYRFDAIAALVPEDLALGWGPMSENRVLQTMDIAQSGRFYWWRPHSDTPISRDVIVTHSANTHVIPADAAVKRQLEHIRVGEVVRLTGTLVDGTRDDGAWIHTSLSRSDTGAGACEVFLVESVDTKWP
jgi:hypothetical protein